MLATPQTTTRTRRRLSVSRVLLILFALVLIGVTVPPSINVGRFRGRIAESLSEALGRPVTIGSMSLRLLPQPGFDLENVVIGDDPAISYEPILFAGEVQASLRLSSLWRGHLEIARLHLKYASLNLVRSPRGDWNLESLLWRAARTRTAPTTSGPQARKRFPYIDSETGRINFKFGLEKSSFALTDADFALWSPAEDEWRMRLKATPFRSDVSITDTGVLRAEGRFRRAEQLRDIPMQMRLSWQDGQLGQISKLIYGRDRGWRGGVQLSGSLEGTPAALEIAAGGSVQDFRRYDISGGEALRLDAKCAGKFSSLDQAVRGLNCQLPFQQGALQVEGEITGHKLRPYKLAVSLKEIPANAVVSLLRHAKRDLPTDLSAAGVLNGSFSGQRGENDPQGKWSGEARGTALVLRSAVLGKELAIGDVHFIAAGTPPPGRKRPADLLMAAQNQLNFDPFALPLGGAAPASATGWISPHGYGLRLQGDTELGRLLQAARATGIAVPRFRIYGNAKVDLTLRGEWIGFPSPRPYGQAQVRAAGAEIPGIASPLQLQTAQLEIADNQISLRNAGGQLAGMNFTAEAQLPRSCEDTPPQQSKTGRTADPQGPCASRVDVQFESINLDELNTQFNPRLKQRPWYRLFGASGEVNLVRSLRVSGRIAARRVALRQLTAGKMASDYRLADGKLDLTNLNAEVLGGTHHGEWHADFTGDNPSYSGSGTGTNLAIAQLATLLRVPLGGGSVSGSYQAKMSGWDAGELWSSAQASTDFDWRNGAMRNLQLGRAPLQFSGFAGRIALAKGALQVDGGRMRTGSGIFDIKGSIADGQFNLQLDRESEVAYRLRGTLQKPVVETPPATAATAQKR